MTEWIHKHRPCSRVQACDVRQGLRLWAVVANDAGAVTVDADRVEAALWIARAMGPLVDVWLDQRTQILPARVRLHEVRIERAQSASLALRWEAVASHRVGSSEAEVRFLPLEATRDDPPSRPGHRIWFRWSDASPRAAPPAVHRFVLGR